MIDYEKPLRFKSPTRQEQLPELIKKITLLLVHNLDNGNSYSHNAVLSNSFNSQPYPDPRVENLKILCLEDQYDFAKLSPKEQYESILQAINIELSVFQKPFIKENSTIARFINAIKAESIATLDELLISINDHHHEPEPVTRKTILFQKEQALAASIWWLDTLKNELAYLSKFSLQDGRSISKMTQQQEQIFVTALADAIWEECKKPENNKKGYSSIYIRLQSDYLNNALKTAGISLGDTSSVGYFYAFVHNNGNVTFQKNGDCGDIYKRPYTSSYNFFRVELPVTTSQPHLPTDEIIQFRDTLSTLSKAHAKQPAVANIYSLPREIFREVMLFAKPKSMSLKKVDTEMLWNTERLKK